jgi:threonine dehydrogenase-like Zn-dependent dehydrogenase
VPAPVAALGEVVVDVERVGVCGTDVEFFTGEMAYLHQGYASYPMRLGHEWAGTVASVGNGVDPAWVGRRVMGDTMLGDGVCRRCRKGYQHVCENRQEVGVRGGRPGALAEQLAVPVTSLHALPDSVDSVLGALVEPGGNAFRAAQAAALAPGDRALVLGPGTIGLLVAMFARVAGAEVHLMGRGEESHAYARSVGFEHVWTEENLPGLPFDAVIDASNAAHLPAPRPRPRHGDHARDVDLPDSRVSGQSCSSRRPRQRMGSIVSSLPSPRIRADTHDCRGAPPHQSLERRGEHPGPRPCCAPTGFWLTG